MKPTPGYWFLLFVSLWIAAPFEQARSIPSPIEKENLHGVRPITVAVSPLPDWLDHRGITREDLREHIFGTLHAAGIDVVPTGNGRDAMLTFTVSGTMVPLRTREGTYRVYVYTSNLVLLQRVRRLADNRVSLANTWSYEKGGTNGSSENAVVSIKKTSDEMVKQFIEDYNSENGSASSNNKSTP
ncbi:MAG TPA: hypothetical protein VMI06_02635 [Terriglobia bacterium]|nr:hypothetical protein [Terriglobia bacterium]